LKELPVNPFRIRPGRQLALLPVLALATLATACSSASSASSSSGPAGAAPLAVEAGETSCDVSAATLPAGRHSFAVTNTSGQVSEVYVYAAGDRIMGEVENIGPATQRTLIVDLPGGTYQIACKPGMVGNGIRTALTVTGAAAPAQSTGQQLSAAVSAYQRYVEAESRALAETTTMFTAAIGQGDLSAARKAYPAARLHYERIEPIAESFGDLDPLIDMRADDVTADSPFVGFHALERLLFQKRTLTGTAPLTTALNTDVAKLATLVKTVRITPLTMGNGAKSLLDEVAKSKVSGEEERYSRIDLVDFAGNVDGARYVYTALRPALQASDAQLVTTLDQRFAALIAALDTHRARPGRRGAVPGSAYVSYDALTKDEVRTLAVQVDSLSEPLGRISGVVTTS
jgi:iron uptake system component EfeO